MSEIEYKSSGLYSQFVPTAMAAMGLGCLVIGLLMVHLQGNWRACLVFATMGGALLAMFWASRGKFGSVVVSRGGIVVEQNGGRFAFAWHNVRSFRTIPFVTPVVYRFAFQNPEFVTYFVPESSFSLNVGFWTFHFSGMGKYIREQLRQTGVISSGVL